MKFLNIGAVHNIVLLKSGARLLFIGEFCAAARTPDDVWYRNKAITSCNNKGHINLFVKAAPKKDVREITNEEMVRIVEDL